MKYRLLIDLEVTESIQQLPKRARDKLFAHFHRLRDFPSRYSDYQARTAISSPSGSVYSKGYWLIPCSTITGWSLWTTMNRCFADISNPPSRPVIFLRPCDPRTRCPRSWPSIQRKGSFVNYSKRINGKSAEKVERVELTTLAEQGRWSQSRGARSNCCSRAAVPGALLVMAQLVRSGQVPCLSRVS